MLPTDVKANRARLVQTGADRPILDRLPEAGVRVQIPGRDGDLDSLQQIGQAIALSSAESELFTLVKASSGAMDFSIRDHGYGTVVEHSLVRGRHCSLGCGTTSRFVATQTRGLQFLVRAEIERASMPSL